MMSRSIHELTSTTRKLQGKVQELEQESEQQRKEKKELQERTLTLERKEGEAITEISHNIGKKNK